jgi:hypothetical protein
MGNEEMRIKTKKYVFDKQRHYSTKADKRKRGFKLEKGRIL